MANAADNYEWNADNIFNEQDGGWDLNPLAMKVGAGADGVRDTLSAKRDAFLQPKMNAYRQAVGPGRADATDTNLFNDENFRGYVKSGTLPQQPQTVTQQWTAPAAAPAAPAATNPQRSELYNLLKSRATQSLQIDPNDPNIAAQTDAYRAEQTRGARNTIADLAEKLGPNANLTGETRMANERAGQATANLRSTLVGREQDAKRQEIQSAIEGMMQAGQFEDAQALQLILAQMDAGFKSRSLDLQQQGLGQDWKKALLQNDQFTSQLGLNAEDRASYWDSVRRGLI
jgi:hypothetical protein